MVRGKSQHFRQEVNVFEKKVSIFTNFNCMSKQDFQDMGFNSAENND